MSRKSDLEELENELFASENGDMDDAYNREVRAKLDRKLIVSNFMETKEQSKVSRLGGKVFSS